MKMMNLPPSKVRTYKVAHGPGNIVVAVTLISYNVKPIKFSILYDVTDDSKYSSTRSSSV